MESPKIADDKVSGIEYPCKPCKLFATDLVASKLLPNGKWKLNTNFKSILPSTLSAHFVYDGTVWIQGVIVQTTPSNTIIIEDETGKAKITYYTTVNDSMSWIKKGSYCMAIGKLLDVSGIPTVSAMKLACLDSDALYKTTWKSEVEEINLGKDKKMPSYLAEIHTIYKHHTKNRGKTRGQRRETTNTDSH